MSPSIITIYSKILVVQEGQYREIVVEDLNRDPTDDLKYVSLVQLPNWSTSDPLNVGDVGYIQFQCVEGGVTTWFNKVLKDFEIYNYTNNYIINFFKQKDICKQDKFYFE
jgi:hypothetical protein